MPTNNTIGTIFCAITFLLSIVVVRQELDEGGKSTSFPGHFDNHADVQVGCSTNRPLADDQTGLPFGAALARAHKGIALGVYGPVGPTLPRLALQGLWGNYFTDNDGA